MLYALTIAASSLLLFLVQPMIAKAILPGEDPGGVLITMAMGRRAFVEHLDFITSMGHGKGGDDRQRLGLTTAGPTRVITDLCVLEPDPVTKELTVVALHVPNVFHRALELPELHTLDVPPPGG